MRRLRVPVFADQVTNVRRRYYPITSPAGKGAKWEYVSSDGVEWYPFDTDTQCLIEEAWAKVTFYKSFIGTRDNYVSNCREIKR